jgi:FtsP/CotA-like multicopper oxidase with cupredoxin domain
MASPGMGAYERQKVKLYPETRYRVRFINMSAFSRYYIWMEGNYDMEVIEIDGVTLKPGQPRETHQLTKGIELASGQRVSVIVGLEKSRSLRRIMVSSRSKAHQVYIAQ